MIVSFKTRRRTCPIACLFAYMLLVLVDDTLCLRLPIMNPIILSSQKVIDMRSDTVTKPSQLMREAMYESDVGDDVYGDDPTVNNLEKRVAAMFNKEASLFFPTGTMSNLAATMSWCNKRGAEIILGDLSHMHLFEQGGSAQIASVSPRTLPNRKDGTMDVDMIEKSIRVNNIHYPITSMIALENTHNFCGGTVLPDGFVHVVNDIAKQRGDIPIHIDGARLWNAATASNVPIASLVAEADSVSVCLSKGLGAPAGSMLIGPAQFINHARRVRKVLGGGMRQVGVLAAAGMVALNDFESGLLLNDHIRAKKIANAIMNDIPSGVFHVDLESVQTNIILVKVIDPSKLDDIVVTLREKKVLLLPIDSDTLRLVIHRDITNDDVTVVISSFKEVVSKVLRPSVLPSIDIAHDTSSMTVAAVVPEVVAAELPFQSDGTVISSSDALVNVPLDGNIPQQQVNAIDVYSDIVDDSTVSNYDTIVDGGVAAVSNKIYYEEAVVHGMSVSPDGFCVILRGVVCDRFLRILVTPSDPMSDGLDREQVETSEAVTLLQLLQGIDVESHLAKDYITQKFADASGTKSKYTLRRVIIDTVMSKSFSATLCGSIKYGDTDGDKEYSASNQATVVSVLETNQPQQLMIEKDPPMTPSSMLSELLPELMHSNDDRSESTQGSATYDTTTSISEDQLSQSLFINDIGAQQAPVSMMMNGNVVDSDVTTDSSMLNNLIVHKIDKEVKVENAFEAIALALRHSAVIEVRSILLQDTSVSYNQEELKAFFPNLLETDNNQDVNHRGFSEDYNSRMEMERLQRQLFEAIRQENSFKIDKIKRQLEFYSNIEGKSVLISPPPSFMINTNASADSDSSTSSSTASNSSNNDM